MSFTHTLYSALGTLLTPVLARWLERRARRGKEDPFRMAERFGHASLPRPPGQLVWLHAASVGETQSVLTLVRALLKQHSTLHLLITTGTVTSAALVAGQQLPRTIHQFVPIDTPAAVQQFLQHWRPNLALWVESEFWPQLLWQAQARRIPMLLINARMSEKTYRSWKRVPWLMRSLLQGFEAIYAGSPEDADRLRGLGARDVREVGNLKYDAAPLPIDHKLHEELSRSSVGRPLFVAASTHDPEEIYVAQAHEIAAQQFPTLLTVIIPRHPNRGDAIAGALRARSISLSQRSKGEPITPTTAVYLADTMGELGTFYAVADVVFMGGSLVPHGGQNPLEPARASRAIITGPYTHNFASIIRQCVVAQAIEQVPTPGALAHTLLRLLMSPQERQMLGLHAADLVEKARGASTVMLQHCASLLARGQS